VLPDDGLCAGLPARLSDDLRPLSDDVRPMCQRLTDQLCFARLVLPERRFVGGSDV
jgi:hypothetical protein